MTKATVAAGVGVLTLGLASAGSAAHVGGLASLLGPKGAAVSATVGYGERDLKGGASEAESYRTLVTGQFGLADGLDLRAVLGLRDIDIDRSGSDFEGGMGESIGVGLRYGLWNQPETGMKVILDGQVEYFRSADAGDEVRYRGLQVAAYLLKEAGAAGRLGYLAGFGGVRLSTSRYDADPGKNPRNENPLGLFGGADYFVTPNVFFSGELHLFDEYALHLGVGYRF